jgi:hypothetical protein
VTWVIADPLSSSGGASIKKHRHTWADVVCVYPFTVSALDVQYNELSSIRVRLNKGSFVHSASNIGGLASESLESNLWSSHN